MGKSFCLEGKDGRVGLSRLLLEYDHKHFCLGEKMPHSTLTFKNTITVQCFRLVFQCPLVYR